MICLPYMSAFPHPVFGHYELSQGVGKGNGRGDSQHSNPYSTLAMEKPPASHAEIHLSTVIKSELSWKW